MPKNSAATVDDIPCELLTRIFLLLKADQDRECIDYDCGPPSYPVAEVFTQVCQCFRDAARGCALLWTTVAVEETTPLARVQAYCSLSGSALLTIRVDLSKMWRTTPRKVDHVFDVLKILLQHSRRWQRLSVHLGMESTVERSVVYFLCTQPAPKLEFLTLSIDQVDAVDHTVAFASPAVPTIFTQDTDKILTLRLRGLAVHVFHPPLHSTTTLHLDGTLPLPIPFSAFADLVTAPLALKHLSVYGDSVEEWPKAYSSLSIISLPNLESLRIHSLERDTFQGILLNIHAPSLRSITLNEMHEDDVLGVDSRRNDRPVSFPQVKELIFSGFDLSVVGYAVMSRMFPSIEVFRIANVALGVSNAFATLLFKRDLVNGASTLIWPRLHTLHVELDLLQDSWTIDSLLRDRKEAGCPLSRVEITPKEDEAYFTEEEWIAETTAGDDLDVEVVIRRMGDIHWPSELGMGNHVVDADDTLFY